MTIVVNDLLSFLLNAAERAERRKVIEAIRHEFSNEIIISSLDQFCNQNRIKLTINRKDDLPGQICNIVCKAKAESAMQRVYANTNYQLSARLLGYLSRNKDHDKNLIENLSKDVKAINERVAGLTEIILRMDMRNKSKELQIQGLQQAVRSIRSNMPMSYSKAAQQNL